MCQMAGLLVLLVLVLALTAHVEAATSSHGSSALQSGLYLAGGGEGDDRVSLICTREEDEDGEEAGDIDGGLAGVAEEEDEEMEAAEARGVEVKIETETGTERKGRERQEGHEGQVIKPASIQFIITHKMRKALGKLGYLESEVNTMDPQIAAVVIDRKLRRPRKGMPPGWAKTTDHAGVSDAPVVWVRLCRKVGSAFSALRGSVGGLVRRPAVRAVLGTALLWQNKDVLVCAGGTCWGLLCSALPGRAVSKSASGASTGKGGGKGIPFSGRIIGRGRGSERPVSSSGQGRRGADTPAVVELGSGTARAGAGAGAGVEGRTVQGRAEQSSNSGDRDRGDGVGSLGSQHSGRVDLTALAAAQHSTLYDNMHLQAAVLGKKYV
ncbi:hypothetical protein B484DRAFT_423310 [Ochromonadaceae sp. CCMP2298]|nr:hypothetical protein B484DRAFT_423310 [Ochromonadaceae sp. CCMP2298]|mmetsp:Transcript_22510/g.50028  ORF Transcript_22510/g.50028 Transcript_22510/m.50028 type:complete len:381 (-) Transcript_22510:344-1486(-)